MRPLELKLRNFRSYFGDEAIFDFRDRRLVGIVGPIGSGKSSLLDAIAFALYGRTPTVAANTKSLIHQRAAEATVSLRFEVEGEVWEAVRMLRRKGASQHALYHYADDGDVEPLERHVLESEVNARVGSLLGLEFDAFGRSVLLAQGRFAEFLRARPGERDKVLKGVFGHDRVDAMREAARRRAGSAAVDIEKLTVRVEQLDRLAKEVVELKAQLSTAEERRKLLTAAESNVSDLEGAVAKASGAAVEAGTQLTDLMEHQSRFPDPERSQRIVSDAVEAGGVRKKRAEALESARAGLVAADEVVSTLRASGEAEVIENASALVAKREPLRGAVTEAVRRRERVAARLDKQNETVDAAAGDVQAADIATGAASQAAERATTALEAATAALHEAQHAEMAAALRSGLVAGEACPVCDQHVDQLPAATGSPRLEEATEAQRVAAADAAAADEARSRAAEAYAVAVQAHTAATAALAGLSDELAAADRDVEAAGAGVAEVDAELAALLGEGDFSDVLARRRKVMDDAAAAATAAREKADRARADHDQAIRDEQGAEKALSALRVDIADLAARIGLVLDDSDVTPAGVSARLEGLRAGWDEAKTAAERKQAEAEADRVTAAKTLAELLAELGVDGAFASALGEVTGRAESLRRDLGSREDEIAKGKGLSDERDALTGIKATFDRVAADLTDARFVRYLLDEERTRLSALGSDHFLRLSAGRYLFSNDGKFDIVDQTSADAVRKAESLSGGETFLASLALALALAEMVARTGGRLDAFFLDEGFGSLDPEHLDLAMDGIEALVAGVGERLVVVVSHVPEMRERVEDLIVLDRDAMTGDTRIVRA
jgi:exonuclease SbcC